RQENSREGGVWKRYLRDGLGIHESDAHERAESERAGHTIAAYTPLTYNPPLRRKLLQGGDVAEDSFRERAPGCAVSYDREHHFALARCRKAAGSQGPDGQRSSTDGKVVGVDRGFQPRLKGGAVCLHELSPIL